MATLDLTTRQRIMQLIAGTLRTSRQLAELVGVPERQIEDHLAHIVRSVARRHGGRAWAESEGPGRGSTFALELPVAP